jgi:hypothetical protein
MPQVQGTPFASSDGIMEYLVRDITAISEKKWRTGYPTPRQALAYV